MNYHQPGSKAQIQQLPATLHNLGWMDHCEVCHGSVEAIPILDPVDVEEAYSYIASCYHSVKWYVWSQGWRDSIFGQEEVSMGKWLVLCREVSSTVAVQILHWSDSIDGHASHFCTYPGSFPEDAIVQNVGQKNGSHSWKRDIIYYPIPRGLSEVCGEWILCEASTCAGQYTQKLTKEHSYPLHNSFGIRYIILWPIWFVQRWWRKLNA